MSDNLRDLLIGDEKTDVTQILCSLGNTSHNEANHARIITRGYHTKGMIELLRYYYVISFIFSIIMTSYLNIQGRP